MSVTSPCETAVSVWHVLRAGGWDSGGGEGCSKAMRVAFEQPLLFQYLYKKKKDISN